MLFLQKNQKVFRRTLQGAILFLCAAGMGCRGSREANVVLISIDTLRADKLGAYQHPAPTSPNLDRRLASEGVTFTQAYSQSPKTTPSHMTMLTSLYPCVHGVELWNSTEPAVTLRPAIDTLAELLHNAGYATVAFTGGGHVHASRGFDQGFDIYKHGGPLYKARNWLRAHGREKKFFLFFHTYLVHDPYIHPLSYVKKFNTEYQGPLLDVVKKLGEDEGKSKNRAKVFWDAVDRQDPATVRFVENLYEAGILRMDETNLVPLLDLLDELDLTRNTLVVFTSDHGEEFLEHGRFLHQDLYAETLHVPLIVRFPGRVPPGMRLDSPVTLLDVMPTILDLVGLPISREVQGRSLVPLWNGGKLEPRPIISEFNGRMSQVPFSAIRDGGFSYISEGTSELLFDIRRDPGELHSIVNEAQETLAARRAQKAAWEAECKARFSALGPPPVGAGPSEETKEELRALGYIQ